MYHAMQDLPLVFFENQLFAKIKLTRLLSCSFLLHFIMGVRDLIANKYVVIECKYIPMGFRLAYVGQMCAYNSI